MQCIIDVLQFVQLFKHDHPWMFELCCIACYLFFNNMRISFILLVICTSFYWMFLKLVWTYMEPKMKYQYCFVVFVTFSNYLRNGLCQYLIFTVSLILYAFLQDVENCVQVDDSGIILLTPSHHGKCARKTPFYLTRS